MTEQSLKSCDFQISYGPSDDRLNGFYIPALSRSVRYDRSAGFFSSSALAVASAGVAHLLKNGGTMRLLVGAELDDADVAAIQKGHDLTDLLEMKFLPILEDPEEMARRRLEVLAWMVAEGSLQFRVVLPCINGKPLPAYLTHDYYHPKEGIFTDGKGDQIAFSGSVNESAQGWEKNYEQFAVYKSWDASAPYLKQVHYRFERLWEGKETDWIAIPIPEAVRQKLIRFRPEMPPGHDPLEDIVATDTSLNGALRERILFQFLRDAPFFPNSDGLCEATAPIVLWPHQRTTANEIIQKFPSRFLLCSEVGLGKTMEAGMALRQLLLSERVKRCLILTPRSVTRQWQEELYEKMGLNIPVYDGKFFTDYFHFILPDSDGNSWEAHPVLIASSQLAKRRERQEELLAAISWDLVIIDEAHHARRKDFLEDRRRPNRLLELLEGAAGQPGLARKTRGLIMLTATPMQIHPLEVWDLMKSLGLGGRWEAAEDNFLKFFAELRKPVDRIDWDFVMAMFQDALATGTDMDDFFARMTEQKIGTVEWEQIRHFGESTKKNVVLKQLSRDAHAHLIRMVKMHTPLRRLMRRSTRRLLRTYREKGILKETVPVRHPQLTWIPMAEDERKLYDRIEEYFSDFYQKYENERKGLGFVMTVYRRRLTSSFCAVQKSLERRLAFLKGQATPEAIQGLTDEDREQEDLELDYDETAEAAGKLFAEEIAYVEDFLREIRRLAGDSKWEQLDQEIRETLKSQDTIVIFTQYTDTLDDLREKLRQVYGAQVACYSGRGGEVWNGYKWEGRSKEEIKNDFREARNVKILLCTDAASEGLNLQTCGILINYDMPWNPMRVEQRIGRIDRIGGHRDVYISNYFYEDTVEARVYQALSRRIDWFEWVVGELQPILSGVEKTIREIALTRKDERKTRLEEAIRQLEEEYERQTAGGFNLDEYLAGEGQDQSGVRYPLAMADLERVLTRTESLKPFWEKHPEIAGAWLLKWNESAIPATFDRDLFDRHPETLRLMSYGEPLFRELLEKMPSPARNEEIGIPLIRCSVEMHERFVVYYALKDGQVKPVLTLDELEAIFNEPLPEDKAGRGFEDEAKKIFETVIREREQWSGQMTRHARQARRLAQEERGRRLLVEIALCEIVRTQLAGLFNDSEVSAGFDEETLQRLKMKGYPIAPLFHLVDTTGLKPQVDDPFWPKVNGKSEREIRGMVDVIRREIKELLKKLSEWQKKPLVETGGASPPVVLRFYPLPPLNGARQP
ncbi:MAG: helicase-related protein [Deltaproteobacteria bacterium]